MEPTASPTFQPPLASVNQQQVEETVQRVVQMALPGVLGKIRLQPPLPPSLTAPAAPPSELPWFGDGQSSVVPASLAATTSLAATSVCSAAHDCFERWPL